MNKTTHKKVDTGRGGQVLQKTMGSNDATSESEHLLRSIVQGFSIPAFVIGKDHKVIYWNSALEKLSKIKIQDIVGTKQHWKAFYGKKRPCMADLLLDGLLEQLPKWYEGKYSKSALLEEAYEATDFFPDLGQNGKWLRFTAAAIRNSSGHLVGALETLEDITEHMLAETLRREGEQRLFSVIEGSPIPTFVIGLDHNILYWNRALEQLSKIPAKEIIGTNQHWRAFYAKERPCMADLLVDQSLETIPEWYPGVAKSKLIDETFEAEGFFSDLGEGGRWLRFTAASIRSSRGVLVGAVETLEDFTERRSAEQRLAESENRMKSIFQGFSIPAFVIDKDHKVMLWNRALEKLSKIPADEMIGTNQQWKAFYGKKRPCMADLLVDSAMQKVSKWYTGKYRKLDPTEEAYEAVDFFPDLGEKGHWLRFTAAVIRDRHGELIGAVETLEDITEQRLAEAAMGMSAPK